MKILSVLFLGFLFFGVIATESTSAQTKERPHYVGVVDGERVCIYKFQRTPTGLQVKLKKCVDYRDVFGHDSISTALLCDYLDKDKCYVIVGGSKSENGSTQRMVSMSTFQDGGEISAPVALTNIQNPGNFFGIGLNDAGNAAAELSDGTAIGKRLFLAGSQGAVSSNDYFSFLLNSENIPTGAKSIIFSNPNNKFALGGTMSRDGGIAVQLSATSTLWQLSTRLLNNGVPKKAPSSWTVPAYHGYSPDITNVIEINSGVAGVSAQKIRYLVYRAFKGVGTSGQQSQIVIVKIDAATGKPLETPKPLTPFKNAFLAPAEAFQSIAIAPDGELMIFTEYSPACKKMILKGVKLASGAVSDPAKVIAGCTGLATSPFGYTGLDITEGPDADNP